MIFGALIGAGIALMFAPESGEKTRRRLRRRLERLREETAEGLERAGASTRRDLARRRKRVEKNAAVALARHAAVVGVEGVRHDEMRPADG